MIIKTIKLSLMKKIFFSALFFVSLITSAFASTTNAIDERAGYDFRLRFGNASNVSWTVKTDFTQVDFDLNGKRVSAFYDFEGELIGTAQKISLEELPVNAKRNFAKKYGAATVLEAIKFETPTEAAYFISAESENKSEIIKVSESGAVSVFKKR
jgi:hypothetical protein